MAQTVIPANGHTAAPSVNENTLAPTCTEPGSYDIVIYCGVCGVELSRTTISVPANGHSPAAVVVENNVLPTCTATGSYDNVVYCGVCRIELSRDTVIVDALGHNTVTDSAVAPTCTATGLTEGKHCSTCGIVIVPQETVGALGHTRGPVVIENRVVANCTEGGTYDNVVYCTACDIELSRTTITITANGHTNAPAVVENYVAPGCITEGSYDNVVYCLACEAEVSRETVPVAATGHTVAPAVTENYVAPGCITEGSYDSVVYCSVCGIELSRTTVPVSPLGHTEQTISGYAPTCSATGLTDGKICSVCEVILVQQTVLPKDANKHNFSNGLCVDCGVGLYTVSFDLDGGAGSADSQTVLAGNKAIAPATNPTKAGFAFVGWYVDGVEYDFNTVVNANVTIVAKWRAVYTVDFDLDGGAGSADSQTVLAGDKATEPKAPAKTGYKFLGWYVGDEAFDFTAPVNANVTVVAKWQYMGDSRYTVSFDLNGGNGSAPNQSVVYGSTLSKPADPTYNNPVYKFAGWYDENGRKWNFDTDVVTSDITLTAYWTRYGSDLDFGN